MMLMQKISTVFLETKFMESEANATELFCKFHASIPELLIKKVWSDTLIDLFVCGNPDIRGKIARLLDQSLASASEAVLIILLTDILPNCLKCDDQDVKYEAAKWILKYTNFASEGIIAEVWKMVAGWCHDDDEEEIQSDAVDLCKKYLARASEEGAKSFLIEIYRVPPAILCAFE